MSKVVGEGGIFWHRVHMHDAADLKKVNNLLNDDTELYFATNLGKSLVCERPFA
jgi:hypothetical protein